MVFISALKDLWSIFQKDLIVLFTYTEKWVLYLLFTELSLVTFLLWIGKILNYIFYLENIKLWSHTFFFLILQTVESAPFVLLEKSSSSEVVPPICSKETQKISSEGNEILTNKCDKPFNDAGMCSKSVDSSKSSSSAKNEKNDFTELPPIDTVLSNSVASINSEQSRTLSSVYDDSYNSERLNKHSDVSLRTQSDSDSKAFSKEEVCDTALR